MKLSFDKNVVGPWVFHKVGKTWGPEGREAIGVVDGDIVLGGAVFEDYTGRCITAHMALEHPHVPLRRLLIAFAQYCFHQMRCEKVLVHISSHHIKAVTFAMKLGFQPEAILKDVMPNGDLLIFSMTREQCGFLPPQQEAA